MTRESFCVVVAGIFLTQTPAFTQQYSTNKGGDVVGVVGDQPGGPPGMKCSVRYVCISQRIAQRLLIEKVQPRYPEDARQHRVEGQVALKAVIDASGTIEELTLVSGHPMLAPAALKAVRQWKYRPYLLNGAPVKVETQVTVSFQLPAK